MKSVEKKCLKVSLKDAEKIRKITSNFIDYDYELVKDEKFIFFPLKDIPKDLSNKIVKKRFYKREERYGSYKEILDIPKDLEAKLPSSYDLIGDIIIINIPIEIKDYHIDIARALLKVEKNVKSVFLKYPVSGEFRIRDIKFLAGIKKTKTIHREYGIEYIVDIEKTYFSPRLANERKRIADLVEHGEKILDMFAGVAPFSIMIAKKSNSELIYANDKNKDAIDLAKENIKINNVLDKVETLNFDSKDLKEYFKNMKIRFDRVIMNLPFSSINFLDDALKIANKKVIIHLYMISNDDELDNNLDKIKKIVDKSLFSLEKLKVNKIKSYAPREFYICIDITAKEKI